MPVTDRDTQALTYLACRLRKETYGAPEWDENGTHAVMKRFVGHSLPLTVERVTRHASDPGARTPAAMERPFLPDAPKGERLYPAKAGEDCRLHPGESADGCRSCAADRLMRDRTPTPDLARTKPPAGWAKSTRQALHAAPTTEHEETSA